VTLRPMGFLLALLALATAVAAAEPPRADLPTYAQGDKWVRSDGLYEMVRIDNGAYVFATPGREFRLGRTLGLARINRGIAVHEFSPPFEVKWPLKVGERTSHRGVWHYPPRPGVPESRGGHSPATLSASVAAWEEVQVRGGTVQAFRIDFTAHNDRSNRSLTLQLWFAGHGAPEVDTRGLERDGLAKYLIPSDADPDDLYSTALPMDELQTIFGRIEAEQVVAFLDACYSGGAGGRTFAAKKTRAGSVDDLFLERLTRSRGRAIITASRTTEVSIELPGLGHGIFSYYLVSGFKGAADLNRDGIISLQELYEYVEQQVTTKSRAVGGNQRPVMKGELEGALPLTKVTGR